MQPSGSRPVILSIALECGNKQVVYITFVPISAVCFLKKDPLLNIIE